MTEVEDKIYTLLKSKSDRDMEAAFRLIVTFSKQRLYQVIRRFLGDHMLTDDVLQNVYIKAFKSIDQFRWESQLYSWLHRIAVTESLAVLKKDQRMRLLNDYVVANRNEGLEPNFDSWTEIFNKAVDRLPKSQRAVFLLKYYDDLTFKEISVVLNTTEGGLKANYHHAVSKIKSHFKKKGLL